MRLLDRYLLRELLVPLGYCLSGFLLLWVAADLMNELSSFQGRKMLAGDIAEYYLVKTPEFLVLVLPIALLLALLYTLTNHARHNEITAIRSAGVSLWRLCLPYLAVGFVASLALFMLNELFVPDSVEAAEVIKNRRRQSEANAAGRDRALNLGVTNSRDQRYWTIPVYHLKTGEMLNPLVISRRQDGSRLVIKADRAARTNGVWEFYHARQYLDSAQTGSLPVLLLETNVLAKPEFSETPEQIKSEMKISASMNTLSLRGTKKADVPILEILHYLHLHPNPSRSERSWLQTKLQGRLATPWTCVVVVLIAVPFGAASGRRNVFVGVASSIVICFSYVVLQQSCLALGAGGTLPPWVAGWLPNVGFGLAGFWLTARVR
jgi:lipopolysaccharide export system permease protein